MDKFSSWEEFEEYLLNLSSNGWLEIRHNFPHSGQTVPSNMTSSAYFKKYVRWAYYNHIDGKFVANITTYGKDPVYFKDMTFNDKGIFITSVKVITNSDITYVTNLYMNPAPNTRYVLFQKALARRVYRLKKAWRNVRKMPARVRRYIRNKTRRKAFWEQ